MFAEFIWNPDRNFFVIPYLNHPITWYGFLFALSFLVGYFLVREMFAPILTDPSSQASAIQYEVTKATDRLALLITLGAVIGARLGHVFFYGWDYYQTHPFDILKIWEGGLASHGGALGAFIALSFFVLSVRKSYPKLKFLVVLDALVVPSAFFGCCVRIGNFINQEITGLPTTVPWAVTFLRPMDGVPGIAVHPVQLYESLFYFSIFIILFISWLRNKKILGRGLLSGWFFLLVFGFRFVIEYLKVPQNKLFDIEKVLKMGQLLSLPFIFFGLFLLIRYYGYVRKKS